MRPALVLITFYLFSNVVSAKIDKVNYFRIFSSPGGRFWVFGGMCGEHFDIVFDSKKNIFYDRQKLNMREYKIFYRENDFSENDRWASEGIYIYDTESFYRKKIQFEKLVDTAQFLYLQSWGSFKNNLYYSHVQYKNKINKTKHYAFFITDPEQNKFIWAYGPDSTAYKNTKNDWRWNKFWVEGISQNYFYITDKIPGNEDSLRMILVNPFNDATLINTVIHKWLLGDIPAHYVDSVFMVGSTDFQIYRFGKNPGYQKKRNCWIKQFDSTGNVFYIDRNNPKYFWGCDLWKYDPFLDKHTLVMKDIFFDEMLITKNGKFLAIPEKKNRTGYAYIYSFPELKLVMKGKDHNQWITADPRYILAPDGAFYVSPTENGKKLVMIYPGESDKNKEIEIPFNK